MYVRWVLGLERYMLVYLVLKEANLFKLKTRSTLRIITFKRKVKNIGDKRY